MQILTFGASRPVPPVMRPGRQRTILQELAHEDAIVSFQGLRRRLGIHQEALRRSLRRLEEDGLAEADEGGYRISQQGQDALAGIERARAEATALLQALLPPGTDVDEVVEALAGRWFGALHWYGRSDGPDETTLIWITDEGRFLRLRLRAGTLTIEADGPWSAAAFVGLGALMAALAPLL